MTYMYRIIPQTVYRDGELAVGWKVEKYLRWWLPLAMPCSIYYRPLQLFPSALLAEEAIDRAEKKRAAEEEFRIKLIHTQRAYSCPPFKYFKEVGK